MKLINLRKKEYFWLWWIFVAAHGLSLVAACRLFLVVASRGYSSLQCMGFLLQWLLSLGAQALGRAGCSSCSMQAWQLQLLGSRALDQQLQRSGLTALRYVGSSWTRD